MGWADWGVCEVWEHARAVKCQVGTLFAFGSEGVEKVFQFGRKWYFELIRAHSLGGYHGHHVSWFSKMTGTALQLDNLDELLVAQLKDFCSAEEQLIKALPKMAEAAHSAELKQAFRNHLEETKGQKRPAGPSPAVLGQEPKSETCQAMKGLIAEGQEMINAEGDPDIKDIGLIAAAQRVEHYEIAGYGCARAFAARIGRRRRGSVAGRNLGRRAHTPTSCSRTWPRKCVLIRITADAPRR